MKSNAVFGLKNSVLMSLLAIICAIVITACGSLNTIAERFDARMAEAIRSMDVAIATLAQQSADWQVVVANLEKEISKDVQSTLRTEIHDLTRSAVLSTGAEVRCNAEFIRIKIRRELIDLRNSLAMELNAKLAGSIFKDYQIPLLPEEEIRPFICDIVPAAVDMSLDPERRTKIDIYGFDLRSLPITASYKSYGEFHPKSLTGASEFTRVMRDRSINEKKAIYERETEISMLSASDPGYNALSVKKVNIITGSFNLMFPWQLFDVNISPSLSVISDFHAVLDLTGSGANLPPNANEIILSWDNKIQTEIPIMTPEKILECRNWDSTILVSPLTFIPAAVENSQYGGHPDREFGGRGPCIIFNMILEIDPSRKVLSAKLYMHGYECPDKFGEILPDYTEVIERKTFTLFRVTDPDVTMQGFNLEPVLKDRYIDNNVNPDFRYYSSASSAAKIEFVGDTNGDEAGNETGATITFNPIRIQFQKCEYK